MAVVVIMAGSGARVLEFEMHFTLLYFTLLYFTLLSSATMFKCLGGKVPSPHCCGMGVWSHGALIGKAATAAA